MRWYLLIHQLPPKPLYLRAKIRQRLAKVGAVALKNSVYVLPQKSECLEDFQWIAQEATEGGGEAYVCEAEFPGEGVDDALVARFRAERAADFGEIAKGAREATQRLASRSGRGAPEAEAADAVAKLRKRLDDAAALDFFGTPARAEAEKLVSSLDARLAKKGATRAAARRREGGPGAAPGAEWRGKTWVTRRDLHIDRLASAWLVRRFVDPEARFRFVDPKAERPRANEIRFDMVGGDLTHEGDRCTFETLVARAGVTDAAVAEIAQIVHDVDLKDGKFGRPDAAGVRRLVDGLVARHPDDDDRLERGFALFDDLYESLKKRKGR